MSVIDEIRSDGAFKRAVWDEERDRAARAAAAVVAKRLREALVSDDLPGRVVQLVAELEAKGG